MKALRDRFYQSGCSPMSPPCPLAPLTALAAGAQIAGAGAVTDVAVPALAALPAIATGVSATSDVGFPGAEAADPRGTLDLCQSPQVAAPSIDEEVPYAAHVAQVEGGRPDLWGQDEALTFIR